MCGLMRTRNRNPMLVGRGIFADNRKKCEGRPSRPALVMSSIMEYDLFRHSFKPLDHAEHYAHRYDADCHEDAPALPDRNLGVKERADPEEQVAQCGCSKPESLAKAEHALRSDFGNE